MDNLSWYSGVMKLAEENAEKDNMSDESPLIKKVAGLKPKFASNEEAHSHYSRELEMLAADEGKTIEQLVKDADSAKDWTPKVQQVLRLSRLVATFSSSR